MSIGTRIKELRTLKKISQAALGKRVGISAPAISDLESGKSVSSTKLPMIASVLGVNALWLETGRGKPNLEHVEPIEVRTKFHPDIEAVIQLMESTDGRGRNKILNAAQDALELHQAHNIAIKRSNEQLTASKDKTDQLNREAELLAKFRQSTDAGKSLILTISDEAPKETEVPMAPSKKLNAA
ncbi:helix-turn-helix domain-containing protein [Solimicrobium silvestre]|uniref:HTH cro/C1-type domain-containing protein n=1 Tax=Solimicrobium silvestre TaxID=2099400 RepID=A0A2S9GY46_9BURK|nr:helix-turn-helix transcriptional regulator [Solimicrobium silvestre]PRC92642.1 hypothetical protein S2091_2697 [Solimicrobium silvestre]